MKVPMGPPPSRNPNPSNIATSPPSEAQFDAQFDAQPADSSVITETLQNPNPTSPPQDSKNSSVPYTIPEWSHPPCHPYSLEVLKDGAIIDQLDVSSKGAYMFGRVDLCDFVLEHPTISRFHAVLQFKGTGAAFIYDIGSTHGTLVNKIQVKKKEYTELHVGDVIRFGQSSRLYAFQGPSELMPPEKDLKMRRNAKMQEEMRDREASLLRAKEEASLADGISWGMTDDPIEEVTEDDGEEVTWQTYKGPLTEKQEKTRAKVLKRAEKVANMKKEIAVIRAKDIAQGGLTQGQQTQIARNEQRISQIMEELENLEETLNESIQESLGARSKKGVHVKTKGTAEDEDEAPSDDDEFYDRAKKKPAIPKVGGEQIETADTLLVKKEAVTKEIEEKTNLLSQEKARIKPESDDRTEGGDALDAYMTGLSTQIVLDTTAKLKKELSTLQSELDRILYLLHIADPTGEAARQRDSKVQTSSSQSGKSVLGTVKKTPMEHKKSSVPPVKSLDGSSIKDESDFLKKEELPPDEKVVTEKEVKNPSTYTVTKPVWLGATEDREMKENQPKEAALNVNDSDGFVDYKDRKKVLATGESTIEEAGPGLIIRKRKQPEEPGNDKAPEVSTSTAAESTVADAVALLLKHKRGYSGLEGEEGDEIGENQSENNPLTKEKPKPKRVLGPERPAFLDRNPDYETWVPPQGQSGDGRTSLNDRYGY